MQQFTDFNDEEKLTAFVKDFSQQLDNGDTSNIDYVGQVLSKVFENNKKLAFNLIKQNIGISKIIKFKLDENPNFNIFDYIKNNKQEVYDDCLENFCERNNILYVKEIDEQKLDEKSTAFWNEFYQKLKEEDVDRVQGTYQGSYFYSVKLKYNNQFFFFKNVDSHSKYSEDTCSSIRDYTDPEYAWVAFMFNKILMPNSIELNHHQDEYYLEENRELLKQMLGLSLFEEVVSLVKDKKIHKKYTLNLDDLKLTF